MARTPREANGSKIKEVCGAAADGVRSKIAIIESECASQYAFVAGVIYYFILIHQLKYGSSPGIVQ